MPEDEAGVQVPRATAYEVSTAIAVIQKLTVAFLLQKDDRLAPTSDDSHEQLSIVFLDEVNLIKSYVKRWLHPKDFDTNITHQWSTNVLIAVLFKRMDLCSAGLLTVCYPGKTKPLLRFSTV